jgi:retron-type reverse transcriptase
MRRQTHNITARIWSLKPPSPTADGKLVQGVANLLLEAIYEPVFSPRSRGSHHNRLCHTALCPVIQDTWNRVK